MHHPHTTQTLFQSRTSFPPGNIRASFPILHKPVLSKNCKVTRACYINPGNTNPIYQSSSSIKPVGANPSDDASTTISPSNKSSTAIKDVVTSESSTSVGDLVKSPTDDSASYDSPVTVKGTLLNPIKDVVMSPDNESSTSVTPRIMSGPLTFRSMFRSNKDENYSTVYAVVTVNITSSINDNFDDWIGKTLKLEIVPAELDPSMFLLQRFYTFRYIVLGNTNSIL